MNKSRHSNLDTFAEADRETKANEQNATKMMVRTGSIVKNYILNEVYEYKNLLLD